MTISEKNVTKSVWCQDKRLDKKRISKRGIIRKHVIGLDLSACDLDKIPREIKYLTHLEDLNLYANKFVIPPSSPEKAERYLSRALPLSDPLILQNITTIRVGGNVHEDVTNLYKCDVMNENDKRSYRCANALR